MWTELRKMADNIGYKLFLDDLRNPPGGDWVVARSYEDAVNIVMSKGFPKMISFDHDLGEGKSGHDFAKWLVEYDMDTNSMPDDFTFNVHSANPVGAVNIEGLLNNYLRVKKEE